MTNTNNINNTNNTDYFEGCLIKGDLGEVITDRFLKANNYEILSPIESPHIIDRVVINKKTLKPNFIDVKTKERRNVYADTGFDLPDYYKYIELNKVMPVVIIFVDEYYGKAFKISLDYLNEKSSDNGIQYPLKIEDKEGKWQIYTPISKLTPLFKLTSQELSKLKSLLKQLYK